MPPEVGTCAIFRTTFQPRSSVIPTRCSAAFMICLPWNPSRRLRIRAKRFQERLAVRGEKQRPASWVVDVDFLPDEGARHDRLGRLIASEKNRNVAAHGLLRLVELFGKLVDREARVFGDDDQGQRLRQADLRLPFRESLEDGVQPGRLGRGEVSFHDPRLEVIPTIEYIPSAGASKVFFSTAGEEMVMPKNIVVY